MSKMFRGSPLLMGDNTVPGIKLTKELKKHIPTIIEACKKRGLDFFDPIIEKVTYDEMSELAAYGGFPVRYPHWSYGMEYEQLARQYEHGMFKISEMVINNDPAYIYCLDTNNLVDDVLVIAHAIAHSDFFKNNIFFEPTNRKMLVKLANHGSRIRKYIKRWGSEKVYRFIDHCKKIETLIDFTNAWKEREYKDPLIKDERKYYQKNRIPVEHEYMDSWINTKERMEREQQRIEKQEVVDQLELFTTPEKDIMGFLKDNAPLKIWEQDILAMLYDESLYFAPQRMTKVMNEGWASYWDSEILCTDRLVSLGQKTHDAGIVSYAIHKMHVLGTKYSMNPYALGYSIFNDIKSRWDKGQFGDEYDNCKDYNKRLNWDQKTNLGNEKIFEVRKYYCDMTFIASYFTDDFCRKNEFYLYKRKPDGKYVVEEDDPKIIRRKLVDKHANGGLPDIRLVDPNFKNRDWFLMEHRHDGRELDLDDTGSVMQSISAIWKKPVFLTTCNSNGDEIVLAVEDESKPYEVTTREEFERKYS